ncbi:MAG: DNA ligase, partial [Firmicutes bacterium HGW-Firmicutes-13]
NRTVQYPELSRLPEFLKVSRAVLDGEMTVLKEGKPSFPAVLERDLSVKESKIKLLKNKLHITYFVFDILYAEDQALLEEPYEKRQDRLRELVKEKDFLKITDNFLNGDKLFSRVKEQELEGIVAKEKNSPYLPGKKSRFWWKIKVKKRQLCTIGGFTSKKGGRISSLLVGAYSDRGLIYLGRVGTGLREKEWKTLAEFLKQRITSGSYFVNSPSKSIKPVWTKPSLALWVEFSEWTPELKLRDPSIKGFTACDPGDCTIER